MKKYGLILASILISTISFSQSFSAEILEKTLYGNPNSSDFAGKIYIYNNSSNTVDIKWVRIKDSTATDWYSSVCDPQDCRSAETDSAEFTLNPGTTTDYMNVHFYPEGVEGKGVVQIKLYEVSKPDSAIILTFNGEAYLPVDTTTDDTVEVNSIINKAKADFNVYPNPAKKILHLSNTDKYNSITIVNLVGKELLKVDRKELVNNSIDISILKQGIYFLRLDNSKCIRFLKE